jgi:hypothetical protein
MSNTTELMSALADGELQGEELAQADALQATQDGQRELAWAREVKRVVRDKCGSRPPESAWEACRARLDQIDRAATTERFVGKYAWGLCAIFLVAILSAAAVNRMTGVRTLPSSNVASLFTGLQPMGSQVPTEAAENVRQAVGLSPNRIANLEARVAELATGAVGKHKAARLTLVDGRGPMVLFVVSDAAGVEGFARVKDGFRAGRINGRDAVSWTESGYLLLLVGDREVESLLAVAQVIRRN